MNFFKKAFQIVPNGPIYPEIERIFGLYRHLPPNQALFDQIGTDQVRKTSEWVAQCHHKIQNPLTGMWGGLTSMDLSINCMKIINETFPKCNSIHKFACLLVYMSVRPIMQNASTSLACPTSNLSHSFQQLARIHPHYHKCQIATRYY